MMANLGFPSCNLTLLVITVGNFLCVIAKLEFNSFRDQSSLLLGFFTEGFFNLDSVPVAIMDDKPNTDLNSVLKVVMMSLKNSVLIFDGIPVNNSIRSSFLIIEESNIIKINQTFLGISQMFLDNWTRILFWFLEPVSEQIVKTVFSLCLNHFITQIVISSRIENTYSTFRLVATNNILNFEKNVQNFSFSQINITSAVTKVIENMRSINWDFDGAILRVKAHPKYLMLQHSKTKGLFGVDASALRNMAKILNFKVELVMGLKNHFGNTFPNGSLVSSIVDLKTHKVDLNINRHVLTSMPEVMLLPSIDNEEFCFIFPYFRGHYKVDSLLCYLSPVTWALVILSIICSALIWRLFNSISRTEDYPVLSILQSVLTTKFFKIHRPFQIVFLSSWGVFVFILLTILRGTVLQSIIRPFWVDEITNLEELLQSNLTIKNRIGIFQVARPNSSLEKVLNRSVVSFLIETDYEFRTSAYFTSKYFRMFLDIAMGGKDHYYTIPECLSDCSVSYLVPKRSPYFNGLQRKILHFQQHGFYVAWFQKFKVKSQLIEEGEDAFYFANSTKDTKTRPFTLQDLMFALYIEIAGVLLSVVIFVCEVMFERWSIGDVHFIN